MGISRCPGLLTVEVGEGGAAFSSYNAQLFSKDMKTLVVAPAGIGTSVVLQAEVETIGEYALAGCKDLTSITALGTVREIDPNAFADEVKASAVVALPAGKDYDERKSVWEAAGFQHFAEPAEPGVTVGPEAGGSNADAGSDAEAAASGFVFTLLEDYTLSAGWEGVEDPAAEVEIPASAEINGVSYRVSTIAANAFANRGALASVTLPATVTSIGDAAFAGCANLASIQLPDTLRELGERAFEATGLTDVWLPASVQAIASRAFASCESLTRIVALGTPQVADDILAGCANLSLYCPYNADNTYPWNLGLIANNNHLNPYGLTLPEEPLTLEVGQQANLFENALTEVPEGCTLTYSYAAAPVSVENGLVTGKAAGTTAVTVFLSLEDITLAQGFLPVTVKEPSTPAEENQPEPEAQPKDDQLKEELPLTSTPTSPEAEVDAEAETLITSETAALSTANRAFSADSSRLLYTDNTSEVKPLQTDVSFEQVFSGTTFKFTVLTDGGSVSVSRSDDAALLPAGNVIIPAQVTDDQGKTYAVTAIADQGFSWCPQITSVSFEEGSSLTVIGERAFGDDRVLEHIALPSTLTSIGANAFYNCASLGTLEIPDGVTEIGPLAFHNCSSLTQIVLGAQCNALTDRLFMNETKLASITVKGTIDLFEKNAFAGTPTENLTIYVPSAAEKTKWENANAKMEYGLVNDNIRVATDFWQVIFNTGTETPASFTWPVAKGQPLSEPTLSRPGYGLAGWYTDQACTQPWDFATPVTSDLPLYAKWVEEAIDEASGLIFRMRSDGASLSVAAADPNVISGTFIIPSSYELAGVSYPVKEIGKRAFFGGTHITAVTIPDSVEIIGVQAFRGCLEISRVTISENSALEVIEQDAFADIDHVASIYLPKNVRVIERTAFYDCPALNRVEFASPNTLEILGESAFQQCIRLTSIQLPDSLREIKDAAFDNCKSLATVHLPSSLESIGAIAFRNCSMLPTVDFPQTLQHIGNEAFRSCSSLKAAYLPASLTSLGQNAFNSCAKLECVTLPATLESLGYGAFSKAPLKGVLACGAYKNLEVSSAFVEVAKENVKVFLPAIAEDGSGDTFETLQQAWTDYGFSQFQCSGGPLPTINNVSNTDRSIASWNFMSDGTLVIASTEELADFGWTWDKTEALENEHWRVVRNFVKSVDMGNLYKAASMECWFKNMSNLTDISCASVPEGTLNCKDMFGGTGIIEVPSSFTLPKSVQIAYSMFIGCASLTSVNFTLPNGLQNVQSMFNGCTSLTHVADSFRMPDSVSIANSMFENTAIESLPDGFTLSTSIKQTGRMFYGCKNLTFLPDSFLLPEGLVHIDSMFEGSGIAELPDAFNLPKSAQHIIKMFAHCKQLSSLPKHFRIPESITPFYSISAFNGCDNLTSLNAEFSMPAALIAEASSLFKSEKMLPLYYEGNDPVVLAATEPWWSNQNRKLVTPKNTTVNFKVSDKAGSGWTNISAASPDESGLVVEPLAPSRYASNQVFTLWYTNESCTQRVDFSKPIKDQVSVDENGKYTLYGKYVAGSLGGNLPTVNNEGHASWSISDDGTFYLRGSGTIDNLGWDTGYDEFTPMEGHWAPYRDLVYKVSMQPGISSNTTCFWFADMPNLVDIQELVVPRDVVKMAWTFQKSSAIHTFPEGFTIPEGVTNVHGIFRWCSSISTFPESFSLPSTTWELNSMFRASGVETLPENFTLPEKARGLRWLFWDCSRLKSLPSRFRIPETGGVDAYGMLENCVSLVSLPEGFKIPNNVVKTKANSGMDRILNNCPSLTVLPSSFSFPDAPEGSPWITPFTCSVFGDESSYIPTYYKGKDPSVLNYDWGSQRRTLVTDSSDANNYGMREVTFKLQEASGNFDWVTRAVTMTNSSGIVTNPGIPLLVGYTFTDWCVDEGCLEPFDFTQPLPEGVTTLYGKWVKHGGRYVAEGALPVDDNIGSAWWSITADGTFNLKCEGGSSIDVGDLTWNDGRKKYWQPYAGEVYSLNMHKDVRARSMTAWFKYMTQLEDVREGFFIPENCKWTQHLFFNDKKLRYLPTGLFPADCKVANIWGMFQYCESLESLPADFTIPESVDTMGCLFYCATSLASLPEGFRLHDRVTSISEAFNYCKSLRSLPENFAILSSVKSLGSAFTNCTNLTVLPAGLLSELSDEAKAKLNDPHTSASNDAVGVFGFSSSVFTGTLPTYFPAPKDQQGLIDWEAQKRTLVTDPAQEGQALVTLMLPNEGGTDFYSWQTLMVAKGSSLDQPAAPKRADGLFAGWYRGGDYTTAVTFPLMVSGNTTLYAKYQPLSGTLPTTREGVEGVGEEATWSLSEDGLLTIDCVEGAKISDLKFGGDQNYWGPVRSLVKKVVMSPTVKTNVMAYWFQNMPNLVDISEVFIPEGAKELYGLFMNCTSLANIPDSFQVPEGATDTGALFQGCLKITALPEAFRIPNSVITTYHMFRSCSSLTALPTGFSLPANLQKAENMFSGCTQLQSFPEGFTLPETLTMAHSMFSNCTSLQSLPEGFKLPDNIVRIHGMFKDCSALTTLPEGFTIPLKAPLADDGKMDNMFDGCNSLKVLPSTFDFPLAVAQESTNFFMAKDADTLTYFAGPVVSAVRQYDWGSQKRKLVVPDDPENPLPSNVHPVTFKLPDASSPDGWATYQSVLTDEGTGKVAKPSDPARFGYPFLGWFTEPDYQRLFDFDSVIDSNEVVVYGKFGAPILRFEAPVQATVEIDATGSVSTASAQARSFTPVEVNVQGLRLDKRFGASKVFDDPSKVSALVQFPSGTPYAVPLGGGSVATSATVPVSSGFAKPGLLSCTVSMDLGGTTLRYIPDASTEVAALIWTVSL
ncbi:MAG TPA: leucine-rich repeat protein [Candidatus Gordonibacter avicola]|nr:leucine-rich repeat protein [Candidatus Gordonibacter avicola]